MMKIELYENNSKHSKISLSVDELVEKFSESEFYDHYQKGYYINLWYALTAFIVISLHSSYDLDKFTDSSSTFLEFERKLKKKDERKKELDEELDLD